MVREHRFVPVPCTVDRFGVRIEQQLGRIAPAPLVGHPRSMHPEAVPLPRFDVRQIPMPAKSRPFGQFDTRFRSAVVEEAQLDALGDFRKYREVGSDSVEGGAEGSMNQEALDRTVATGFATFFSRTRGKLWTKGETSGNRLKVERILVDCDDDTVLVRVTRLGDGNVCHTGDRSCFSRAYTR